MRWWTPAELQDVIPPARTYFSSRRLPELIASLLTEAPREPIDVRI